MELPFSRQIVVARFGNQREAKTGTTCRAPTNSRWAIPLQIVSAAGQDLGRVGGISAAVPGE
jgi:hypothetical protein